MSGHEQFLILLAMIQIVLAKQSQAAGERLEAAFWMVLAIITAVVGLAQ